MAATSDRWRRRLSALAFGAAGFVAYELGLHVYMYAMEPSNEAPLSAAFVAGPSAAFGVLTAVVAGRLLTDRPCARQRALRAVGGYLLLLSALLVGVMQRVPGMSIPGAVTLIGLILFLSVFGLVIAPVSALLLVSENGFAAVFGMLATGVGAVGPLLFLIWMIARKWSVPPAAAVSTTGTDDSPALTL